MGKRHIHALAQQDDGPRGAFELGGLGLAHRAELARLVHRSGHNGERLAGTALAVPQPHQRIGVLGVAHQVVAAQTLHGNDAALADDAHCGVDEAIGRLNVVRPFDTPNAGLRAFGSTGPPQVGAAFEAGVGLGMEAAVRGVVVFRLALRAHLEFRHRG